jgi:hypothetical protein
VAERAASLPATAPVAVFASPPKLRYSVSEGTVGGGGHGGLLADFLPAYERTGRHLGSHLLLLQRGQSLLENLWLVHLVGRGGTTNLLGELIGRLQTQLVHFVVAAGVEVPLRVVNCR